MIGSPQRWTGRVMQLIDPADTLQPVTMMHPHRRLDALSCPPIDALNQTSRRQQSSPAGRGRSRRFVRRVRRFFCWLPELALPTCNIMIAPATVLWHARRSGSSAVAPVIVTRSSRRSAWRMAAR